LIVPVTVFLPHPLPASSQGNSHDKTTSCGLPRSHRPVPFSCCSGKSLPRRLRDPSLPRRRLASLGRMRPSLKRRWRFSLSRIGQMSTSPIRRLTSSARSACSKSPTSSDAALMATATAGAPCTWAPMALRATTAVAGAAFLPFRPPQFSLCRRTAATIGTGQSSLSGATMKAAMDMKRFTTEP